MVDVGVVVGVAGVGIAALSIIFAVAQTRAQRAQAQGALRVAFLDTNQAMFERVRETRRKFGEMPRIFGEWERAHPHLAAKYAEVGGVQVYNVLREAMDSFQDVYFLRKEGVVTDQYWHVWQRSFFTLYAGLPTFRNVFEFAAREGYLHPEFAEWYRPKFEGRALVDPLSSRGATQAT